MDAVTGNDVQQSVVTEQEQPNQSTHASENSVETPPQRMLKLKVYGEEQEVTEEEAIAEAQRYRAALKKSGGRIEDVLKNYETMSSQMQAISEHFEDPKKAVQLAIQAHGDKAFEVLKQMVLERFEEEERLKAMDPIERKIMELQNENKEFKTKLSEKEKKEAEYRREQEEKALEAQRAALEKESENLFIQKFAPHLEKRQFNIGKDASEQDISDALSELGTTYKNAMDAVYYAIKDKNPDLDIDNPEHVKIMLSDEGFVGLVTKEVEDRTNKFASKIKSSLAPDDIVEAINKHGVESVIGKLSQDQVQKLKVYLNRSEGSKETEPKKKTTQELFGISPL